jgi:hypothetical protein
MISLGDMVNAIADKMRPPSPRSKISEATRRKAVRLLHGAAKGGQLKLLFEDGRSLPAWHWCQPNAEMTLENGVFYGPENEAECYQPMFAYTAEFEAWFATVPGGGSKSTAVQSPADETVAQEKSTSKPAAPPPAANRARGGDVASDAASKKRGKPRAADPTTRALLKTRIEQVHAAARGVCDRTGRMLGLKPLSEKLKGTAGYSAGTIRQILNGTYSPMKKLGIGQFKWQPPKRSKQRS